MTRWEPHEATRSLEQALMRVEISRLVRGLPHADGVGAHHLISAVRA